MKLSVLSELGICPEADVERLYKLGIEFDRMPRTKPLKLTKSKCAYFLAWAAMGFSFAKCCYAATISTKVCDHYKRALAEGGECPPFFEELFRLYETHSGNMRAKAAMNLMAKLYNEELKAKTELDIIKHFDRLEAGPGRGKQVEININQNRQEIHIAKQIQEAKELPPAQIWKKIQSVKKTFTRDWQLYLEQLEQTGEADTFREAKEIEAEFDKLESIPD